jgi:Iron-containing redox enzyme
MDFKSQVEAKFREQTEAFAASSVFRSLENGNATRREYDEFIAAVCRTHLKSPLILAFLYSVAPPAAAENLKHNLIEELGLDEEGISHPALLLELATAAGFDEAARNGLESLAQETLRRNISDPILYGTLKELGLSVLIETVGFEWMLARTASNMAGFLLKFRSLNSEDLRWFHHHSEVDIRHADEGLQAIADYIEFYEFDGSDVEIILEITFRENIYIKRYFGEIALAKQTGVFV